MCVAPWIDIGETPKKIVARQKHLIPHLFAGDRSRMSNLREYRTYGDLR